MHLVASSGSAFAINGFAGMSGANQLSFWLSFILFNGYVVLEALSLTALYFAARPRDGHPNPAAIWYFAASVLGVLAFISTVWGAPAEKTFLDDAGTSIALGTRAVHVLFGVIVFGGGATLCLLAGAVSTARRRREASSALVI